MQDNKQQRRNKTSLEEAVGSSLNDKVKKKSPTIQESKSEVKIISATLSEFNDQKMRSPQDPLEQY